MSKIFFIGDSITTGAWAASGGWANRLTAKIMEHTIKFGEFYCMPYNLGISGDTVADILARMKCEVRARLGETDTIQIVYFVGVNDSLFSIENNCTRFSDDEFRANLERLIAQSREITPNISFIGLLPVDDDLLNPIPWTPDCAYVCEHVKRFNGIIADVCAAHDLPFLPLFEQWMNMPDYKKLFIDGVHPNDAGHALLEKQIGEFLFTDAFFAFHKS